MANFMAVSRTNTFKVTDENAYAKLIKGITGYDVYKETETDADGNTTHFIGAYSDIDWYPPASENEELMEFIKDHKIYDELDMEIHPDEIDDNDCIYDKDNNMVFNKYRTDSNFDEFLSRLQKLLPDGEVFTYTTIGHEKLRDVYSYTLVMTNKEIRSISTDQYINDTTNELLGK